MTKYVITAKVGSNGISATVRDTDTGNVGSFDIHMPREMAQDFLESIKERPDTEVKVE